MNQISTRKKVIVLIVTLCLVVGISISFRYIEYIDSIALTLLLFCDINLILGIIAAIAMKITNMSLNTEFRNYKQFFKTRFF